MKKKIITIITITLILQLIFTAAVMAVNHWTFEAFLGSAYSVPTNLSLQQEGESEINIKGAEYSTKPMEESPYYSWRVSRWNQNRAWELELVHHKLYLDDTKYSTIDHFEITHGYNLVTINRAWKRNGLIYRLGGGIVLAHPEFEIRGKAYPEHEGLLDLGFYVAGPTVQASLAKQYRITENIFTTLEGKMTASHARLTLHDLKVTAPNIAFHGLVGMGYKF